MAGSGLLALLDDITTMLDDIAVMTKVAAGKAITVVGDDIAVGAEQVSSDVTRAREIPIIRKVAMGSLRNKLILTPITLGVSALTIATGWPLIAPLLALGGTYLCHESFEKITHKKPKPGKQKKTPTTATKESLEAFEKKKVKGAIKTDFILSSEIMLLTLGAVAAHPLLVQLGVLVATGICMTAVVYGLVAGVVKLDDLGLLMLRKKGNDIFSKSLRGIGRGLVNSAPKMMKVISFTGTAAMFLVGGGILMHHTLLAKLMPHVAGFVGGLASTGAEILTGLVAGGVALIGSKTAPRLWRGVKRLFRKPQATPPQEEPEIRPAPAPEENVATPLGPRNTISPVLSAAAVKKEEDKAPPAAPLKNNPSTPAASRKRTGTLG